VCKVLSVFTPTPYHVENNNDKNQNQRYTYSINLNFSSICIITFFSIYRLLLRGAIKHKLMDTTELFRRYTIGIKIYNLLGSKWFGQPSGLMLSSEIVDGDYSNLEGLCAKFLYYNDITLVQFRELMEFISEWKIKEIPKTKVLDDLFTLEKQYRDIYII